MCRFWAFIGVLSKLFVQMKIMLLFLFYPLISLLMSSVLFLSNTLSFSYLDKCTIKTDMSEGDTPEILDAWPRVLGLIFISFSRASLESDTMLL